MRIAADDDAAGNGQAFFHEHLVADTGAHVVEIGQFVGRRKRSSGLVIDGGLLRGGRDHVIENDHGHVLARHAILF